MKKIAIIAALPGELKYLVRGWERLICKTELVVWRKTMSYGEIYAVAGGMGTAAATRALAAVEEAAGSIDRIISLGWAGATSGRCELGKAYRVMGVVDVRTSERHRTAEGEEGLWLATSAVVAGEQEKQRLTASYNVSLVDMEASALARLALMRDLPFDAVKGVSDGLGSKLPDFNRFVGRDQQLKMAAFVAHVLIRPWYWPGLIRMGDNSKRASRAMAEMVLDICRKQA